MYGTMVERGIMLEVRTRYTLEVRFYLDKHQSGEREVANHGDVRHGRTLGLVTAHRLITYSYSSESSPGCSAALQYASWLG